MNFRINFLLHRWVLLRLRLVHERLHNTETPATKLHCKPYLVVFAVDVKQLHKSYAADPQSKCLSYWSAHLNIPSKQIISTTTANSNKCNCQTKAKEVGRKPAKLLLPVIHFQWTCFSCVKCECCLFLSSSFMNHPPPAVSRKDRASAQPGVNTFPLQMMWCVLLTQAYFVSMPPWLPLCII